MKIKTKGFAQKISIKAKKDAPEGTFTAYGNVFGVKDHAGDITVKGCFANTIAQHKSEGTMPRLLAQHGHRQMPIGIITDMIEDEKGLRFEGQFCVETQAGAEAYALCKMGAIDQFSIGYATIKETLTAKGNMLEELDVKEISLVTFACNEESTLVDIKSAIENEELTPRMLQKALRDALGLSKRQSEAAINAIKSTESVEDSETNTKDFEAVANGEEGTAEVELDFAEAFRAKMKETGEPTAMAGMIQTKSLGGLSFQDVLCKIRDALVDPIGHYDFYLCDVYEDKGFVEFADYRKHEYKYAMFAWELDDEHNVQMTSFITGSLSYDRVFVADATEEDVKDEDPNVGTKETPEEPVSGELDVKSAELDLDAIAAALLGSEVTETKDDSESEIKTKSEDFDLDSLDLSGLIN